MDYHINWNIQDSKLSFDTGRIVVYNGFAIKSNGPSQDHNDLVRALASRNKLPREKVGQNGYRFYWKPINRNLINISPVRKLDENWVYDHLEQFNRIIDGLFKR